MVLNVTNASDTRTRNLYRKLLQVDLHKKLARLTGASIGVRSIFVGG